MYEQLKSSLGPLKEVNPIVYLHKSKKPTPNCAIAILLTHGSHYRHVPDLHLKAVLCLADFQDSYVTSCSSKILTADKTYLYTYFYL